MEPPSTPAQAASPVQAASLVQAASPVQAAGPVKQAALHSPQKEPLDLSVRGMQAMDTDKSKVSSLEQKNMLQNVIYFHKIYSTM